MSDEREDSPDWLRSFQAPSTVLTLSSDSEPSGANSPVSYERDQEEGESTEEISIKSFAELSKKTTTKKKAKLGGGTPAKRRKAEKQKKTEIEDDENDEIEESSDKQMETAASNHLAWAISSDSESDINAAVKDKEANGESSPQGSSELLKEEKIDDEEFLPKAAKKKKSPKKQQKDETAKKKQRDQVKVEGEVGETDVPEEEVPEKQVQHSVNSSRLPLTLPDKVSLSKALVECEGDSIDLSGDVGAVGRIIIPETPGEHELLLDLKGTIYKTTIVPSRTFCVVSVGQSEAKIEAIMNDFIQLVPQSNVFDAETMVEGTLDGYSFDSDDEADKVIKDNKGDQNEDGEEKPDKKSKGKPEKKQSAAKKGKAAGAKQPKKRKPQAAKKGKTKK